MVPDPKNFETFVNGRQTKLVSIKNEAGLEATVCNYGARIITLTFNKVNVTPAYSTLEPYTYPTVAPYHGATIGRYANRIANGRFNINGTSYTLPTNNPPNHLHGGPEGFHAQVWQIESQSQVAVTLSYLSRDGEEGYPGEVAVTVSYTLTQYDELLIEYRAVAKAATPFNITNHAFFNLNGEGSILNHELLINADRFTPVDETLIPTGELKNVDDSAFDFRTIKRIGDDIERNEEQIKIVGGYDHNFILNKRLGELSFAAKAIGDQSGIIMEVFTKEPGIQLFSGNFEAVKGDPSTFRNTFCLETQHFPDSPNQSQFPDTILKPGDLFNSQTIYKFTNY